MNVNKFYFLVFFIVLSVFSILSNPFGVDWPAYITTNVDFTNLYYLKEPLGWSYAQLVRYLPFSNYVSFIIILFLLFHSSYLLLDLICKDNFLKILVCIVLIFSNFYLLFSTNGLRQGLAMVFLLYSIVSTYKEKNIQKYFFFIIGVMFHNSLLLFFPLIFLSNFSLLSNHIFVFPILFVGELVNSFSGKSQNLSVNDNSLIFLIVSLFLFLFQFFLNFINKYNDKKIIFYNSYLIILSLAFYSINSAYERIVYFVIPLQIILFSSYLLIFKPKYISRLLMILIAILSCSYSLTHPSVTNNFINL